MDLKETIQLIDKYEKCISSYETLIKNTKALYVSEHRLLLIGDRIITTDDIKYEIVKNPIFVLNPDSEYDLMYEGRQVMKDGKLYKHRTKDIYQSLIEKLIYHLTT